jgi:hypothetical protein
MTISFVNGQMLNSNLQRGTANLAFQTNLIYLDVVNSRVGIGTSSTSSTLTVAGNITVGNIVIPNVGNVSLGNVNVNNMANPVANSDAATKYYVDNVVATIGNVGNLTISNTTVSTSLTNGNITLKPTGTGTAIINTSTGLVLPVGNTSQQPGTPSQGTMRFNSQTVQLEIFDGSQWLSISNNQSVITNQTITPDGISTSFPLSQSSTSDAVLVTINGISQTPTIDYSVSGSTITFTTTPLDTDIVQVRFIAATTALSALALPTYTVAQTANIASPQTGLLIYVSNGNAGQPCIAVYSGGGYKRISLGANISAV